MKKTMKFFHNEKRGVKEQNRNIPHFSFSTRKNTPQKKITQKNKTLFLKHSTSILHTVTDSSIKQEQTHNFIKERSNSIRSPSNTFSAPYTYLILVPYSLAFDIQDVLEGICHTSQERFSAQIKFT